MERFGPERPLQRVGRMGRRALLPGRVPDLLEKH
jgi:hypothetical protein